MACERYRDALSDVAAGASASADMQAHVASCAACSDELGALRQALTVADDELARLRVAEPSRELAARIRTALADSAQAAPRWRLGWGFTLAAAAAVVVAAAFVARKDPRQEPPALVTDRGLAHTTPPAAALSPVADAPPLSHVSRQSRRERVPEPEVLVPVGEAEALFRFAASLQRRAVTPDSLLVADLSAPLPEPKDVFIRPLEIVPLDPDEASGAE